MTRYKKYVREKGFKLEEDYPAIPFSDGYVTFLGMCVSVSNDGIAVSEHYDVSSEYYHIGRDGNIICVSD